MYICSLAGGSRTPSEVIRHGKRLPSSYHGTITHFDRSWYGGLYQYLSCYPRQDVSSAGQLCHPQMKQVAPPQGPPSLRTLQALRQQWPDRAGQHGRLRAGGRH